jgi:hypothetical protein
LEFEGPFHIGDTIESRPGLFALFCETDNEYELLEIDHADKVDGCLENEEYVNNIAFYQENCSGTLCAAIHFTDDLTRKERAQLKDELLAELGDEESAA